MTLAREQRKLKSTYQIIIQWLVTSHARDELFCSMGKSGNIHQIQLEAGTATQLPSMTAGPREACHRGKRVQLSTVPHMMRVQPDSTGEQWVSEIASTTPQTVVRISTRS